MARIPRVVVPDAPHHVLQRGSRRARVFFSPDDYRAYLELLSEQTIRHDVRVWAYCLMPNHVHLILVPSDTNGLSRSVAETHRRYALRVNSREGWCGHLWQERFRSFAMDEGHLLACLRYVLFNPVRAGLVSEPSEWPYSSLHHHEGSDGESGIVDRELAELIAIWSEMPGDATETSQRQIRKHTSTGRPLGGIDFIERIEELLGRTVRPKKRGRKPKRRQTSD